MSTTYLAEGWSYTTDAFSKVLDGFLTCLDLLLLIIIVALFWLFCEIDELFFLCNFLFCKAPRETEVFMFFFVSEPGAIGLLILLIFFLWRPTFEAEVIDLVLDRALVMLFECFLLLVISFPPELAFLLREWDDLLGLSERPKWLPMP